MGQATKAAEPVSAKQGEILVVATNAIQPGDILLTRGHEKYATRIGWLTGGPFAHASLFISPYLILESLGDGIGISPPTVWRYDSDRSRLYVQELEEVGLALLLRHRQLGNLHGNARTAIADDLAKFATQYIGLKYPDTSRLIPASAGRPKIMRRLTELARYAGEKLFPPDDIAGPFCSELIALCYEGIKKPLFDGITRISPNDFYRSNLLAPVPGAISSMAAKSLTKVQDPAPFLVKRDVSIQSARLMQQAIRKAKRL